MNYLIPFALKICLFQIVLVTDGNLGMTLSDKVLLKSRLLPFACQLHVVVIAPAEWSHIKSSVTFYKNFIRVHSDGGEVFLPEGHVNYTSVQHLCHSLAQKCYSPFITTLVCGSIKSKVNIFPAPQPFEGCVCFVIFFIFNILQCLL